jgi:2'-5' RNA ligase
MSTINDTELVFLRQMRLFIAVNFPSKLKNEIGSLISDLKEIPADLKWVEAQNIHLTLQFLGNVSEEQVTAVVEALKRAAAGAVPLTLKVGGVGVFPSRERPRVFWAGISGDTAALLNLSRRVQREMRVLGFAQGKNTFSPHLTLARLRSAAGFPGFIDMAEKLAEKKEFGAAKIKTIELMLSELSSRGPKYFTLASVQLTG